MALRFESIVTPQDIARVWGDAEAWDPLAAENLAATEAAAHFATDAVEAYLSRHLIARKHAELSLGKSVIFLARHLPVLQPVSGCEIWFGNQLRSLVDVNERLEYYGGYRRSDQRLADFQALYPDLTVEPPLLPQHIVDVAAAIAVRHLRHALHGRYGADTDVQQIGTILYQSRSQVDMSDLLSMLDTDRYFVL